ncbi:hypothetical protein NVP1077O_06 [Vibrio phage 1.077.O._10N.261.45.A10]|nr:hypothetical protein NVP1070O_06 [Vibrio phage 1.070.O._10N.261.45.B2]AUR85584.1 hypothetical protein NVP1077O_06 [Vibrio phage 1.077.O._10N.261.45.A10]
MSELSELKLRVDEVRNGADTDLPDNLLPVTSPVWIRYNGSTNTILDSHGVSSLIDIGTGLHDVTFTTDFATADYVVVPSGGTSLNRDVNATITNVGSMRLSAYITSTGAAVDITNNHAVIFGGQ